MNSISVPNDRRVTDEEGAGTASLRSRPLRAVEPTPVALGVRTSGLRQDAFACGGAGLDEPVRNCVASQSRHVVNAELVYQPLPMSFDGLDVDTEFRSNLLVAAAFGDQLQDLRFAGRQQCRAALDRDAANDAFAIIIAQPLGNGRAEECV